LVFLISAFYALIVYDMYNLKIFSMSKSKYSIRRSTGAVLLVGVLAGVTVGGGVGVIAASSTKTVTVCVDKKDNHLNYSKGGVCKSHQTKLVLNQAGPAGATGATGAKGDTGATGATGPAGSSGSGGGASAPVATGTNCIASKCTYKVGDTGPGGGIIFFVDFNDQYTGLNYLEAAPVGWGNGITVNQGDLTGETSGSATVDPKMSWCNTSSLLGLDAWANSAVGVGGTNTSTADTTCAGGAIQAVSDYAGGTNIDWFLPSVGEAMLMYTNLRQVGVGGFASGCYWSSSEYAEYGAWVQDFGYGLQVDFNKTATAYVRPVRAF